MIVVMNSIHQSFTNWGLLGFYILNKTAVSKK